MCPGGGDRTTETIAVLGRGRETSNPPIAPTARLVCVAGAVAGRSFTIDAATPMVIGRSSEATIMIDAPEISRRHTQIRWQRGQFVVSDLGSRNGTLVNGESIGERALASGDRIQIGGWTVFVFSIHDELEQRAMRLQKLESLATLTGGIVHDFKNTLGAILANAEMLRDYLEAQSASDAAREMVDDITVAARTSLETARRLLYFSDRDGSLDLVRIELRGLADEVVGVAKNALTMLAIKTDVRIAPHLVVRGRRDELHHVLLNLVMNARDAMPAGGELRLTAEELVLTRTEAVELHLPLEGRYVEIVVADTGCGMDAATQARAFEPFFTTKPAHAGTGLGLATVYGVVRRLGGNVLVDSAVGRGTKLRIVLPAA